MSWQPDGIAVRLGSHRAFSLSDAETSSYQRCPARAGIVARTAQVRERVESAPFNTLLIAMLKDVVAALAEGRRRGDRDGGLAWAARTYQSQHPGLREFLDVASLNYLEFLEEREQTVGRLTYVDHSHRRSLAEKVALKLWAPVYRTAEGGIEVHRLRNRTAKSAPTNWASGAAWVVADRQPVTVIEFGLSDGTAVVHCDSVMPDVIEQAHWTTVRPALRDLDRATDLVPGSDCAKCPAVAVCPAVIPMDVFLESSDAASWVRSVSESDLARFKLCPAKAFMRHHNLPSESTLDEAALRGIRVHEWIAAQHTTTVPCAGAQEEAEADEVERTLLAAHAEQCDRGGRETLHREETLVGRDGATGTVIFMKPDEVARRGDTLVLREIKTTSSEAVLDRDAALQRYGDAVAWWLACLRGGLREHFGAARAQVELEVLTARGGAIHIVPADGPEAEFIVQGWLLDTPTLWLSDNEHLPNPGAYCGQCEYLRWCKAGRDEAGP